MGVTSPLVTETLRSYACVVTEEMQRYLPGAFGQGDLRRYLYDLVSDYPRRWGKMMRPSICLATAQAFGAPLEVAVPAAVSIELLHNSLLIHDDIEDESDERRGAPTLHKIHGLPLALNAGSALGLLSLYPLLSNRSRLSSSVSTRILLETMRVGQESAEGQALELGWCRDNRLDLAERDYLELVLKKTCWLATIHPVRAGALIALGARAELDRFVSFGFFLGAAFQIQDDVLNLIGDTKKYGKELAGDLWEGKRTLILIELLSRAKPDERRDLRRFFGKPRGEKLQAEVDDVLALLQRYNVIDVARSKAEALAGAAQHEFERAFCGAPASRHKDFLRELPTWVFERSS
jgi:geranylgeranyl diphosphate synthase, type II